MFFIVGVIESGFFYCISSLSTVKSMRCSLAASTARYNGHFGFLENGVVCLFWCSDYFRLDLSIDSVTC